MSRNGEPKKTKTSYPLDFNSSLSLMWHLGKELMLKKISSQREHHMAEPHALSCEVSAWWL